VLAEQVGVPCLAREGADPVEICKEALEQAEETGRDVLIFDTAGRLAVDDVLMDELEQIVETTRPENIFLVADAMIGQDAVNTAKEFNERLEIDGFIMTKLDGDARGGAALSIKEVTGKPIKFIGVGEKLEDLERFRPEGLANRILGFGDLMGLMDRFEKTLNEEEAERAEQDAMRMLSGEFDFNDFYKQLEQISRLGSMQDLMGMMPGMSGLDLDEAQIDDHEMVRIRAIIQSMTEEERTEPDLLTRQPSRVRRIAGGARPSGWEPNKTRRENLQPNVEKVEQVIQQFNMMRGMMQQFSNMGGGFLDKIPGFGQLNKMRQLKDMDIGSLFQDMMGMGPSEGGSKGASGGIAGMPGMGGLNLPPGYSPPGTKPNQGGSKSKSMDRSKRKRKRKIAKKARRRSRRRKHRKKQQDKKDD
jgi:signal recognition particle subunit SRP54